MYYLCILRIEGETGSAEEQPASNKSLRYTVLTYIDFLWRTDGSRLKIWYDDGYCDDMYYGFDDGCLIVSSSRHFTQYIGYRPAGFYYEQEKSIDPAKAKSFNPTTDERPRSATATIKAKE